MINDPTTLATTKVADITVEELAEAVAERLREPALIKSTGPDLTIADIQRIMGVGNSSAYDVKRYHGEYQLSGRRLIRREVFDYRRKQGLDVAVTTD